MLPRPKRFILCGVPVTYELALRIFLLAVTLGMLVAASLPKINSILQQANVVSVSLTEIDTIAAPGMLVCGERMDSVDVQLLTRGVTYPNGTNGPDVVRPAPAEFINISSATALNLRANGDWPSEGNCVVFSPKGNVLFTENNDGSNRNATDQIIFVVQSNTNFTGAEDVGLSIAMWDGNLEMQLQQAMWVGIPSINTLTFVYTEHKVLNSAEPQKHYTLQKQNLRMMHAGFFEDQKVIGRVLISPDTFYVNKYIDKQSYTWVDLAGAVGGMASIALAVWIFLFGSGKYKSWGIMQRYILRTSPNSERYPTQNGEQGQRSVYEATILFFKKQLSRLDSSADPDQLDDHLPLKSPGLTLQDRRLSARYSTAMSMSTANAAAAAVTGGAAGLTIHPNKGSGNADMDHIALGRYSAESSGGPANYYFSEQGIPRSQSLRPLAPINAEGGEEDEEEQVSELIRLIDLRIDERMWSLERTLARYYLEGFRLRNYSSQFLNGGRASYYPVGDISPGMPRGVRDEEEGSDRYSRLELLHTHSGSSGDYTAYSGSDLSTPAAPPYPPRPQVRQEYGYIGEAVAGKEENSKPAPAPNSTSTLASMSVPAPGSTHTHAPMHAANRPPAGPSSQGGSSNSLLEPPGFPHRKDMRGTIRRAVERLQNEWPQNQVPEVPYVPRTQYQGGGNNGGGPSRF
ncbi:hypothetical protein BC939DRAFT_464734 [Gamsiella multidivaricata]|uniref:uncharacterized protein n=1 Tax=Gamsiella multidivaricata TaxID=101098 RepID=UPI00221F4708|nr:uncharacterized protein BC939DRAFT_464734 [Gamsiella multidivaricata]KAG0364236.1 hypothetical protein BGZ54_007706 [Gamsiella multidivaricata]KAI7817792.1 hypothetical protein BC939DRAFT_464734 [Gamsiella multidivaricata]